MKIKLENTMGEYPSPESVRFVFVGVKNSSPCLCLCLVCKKRRKKRGEKDNGLQLIKSEPRSPQLNQVEDRKSQAVNNI
jgi:hypothetical protein